ncbi:PepSY domain-containing protein [Arenibacter sp. 6A1]|uniref:PepSY-associated TM helix domain-containing protein n=1 Tax=Arenibacter sp. 6A1 TaxID=2720391 RepID=UPI00144876EC|nr:PepSY-associated TM helix domain-containing protein [Arenibacter sp. 6A1]NKI26719.1 PepSY domain-containing protein [Arenibacter sp. 6A1]
MTKKKSYTFRKFINDIHLWLGLISGIILFIICFTGTVLTYEKEIKAFFSEEPQIEAVGEKQAVAALAAKLTAHTAGLVTRVSILETAEAPYAFTVKKDPKERRGTTYLMNPYTGEILQNKENPADGFMMTMFKLHRWLLLDIPWGRPIIGIATIIFIILSISGLVLWFPKKLKWKNLKHGLKIKTDANWKRINHDLHNTLGFYACIFLLVMGLTGLCWSFEGYREGMGNILGTKVFGNRDISFSENTLAKEGTPISYDKAIALANNNFSFSGKLTLSFPSEKTPYYTMQKYDSNSWLPNAADSYIVDLYGNTLHKELFREKPLNVQIATMIKPLHTGDIFGGFSKFLYFIACLIGTSLPISGTLIWWNKLKKNKGKQPSPNKKIKAN